MYNRLLVWHNKNGNSGYPGMIGVAIKYRIRKGTEGSSVIPFVWRGIGKERECEDRRREG